MANIKPLLVSFIAAIVAGYLQIGQPDLLITVIYILIAGIILGAVWPDNSWVWGIILGLGVPAAYLIGPSLGAVINETTRPNILITFAAILPAIAGTTSGVVLKYANKKDRL